MAIEDGLQNRPSDFAESAKDEMKRDVHGDQGSHKKAREALIALSC